MIILRFWNHKFLFFSLINMAGPFFCKMSIFEAIISLWAGSLSHRDLVHLSQQYHPGHPEMDKTMTWEISHYKPLSWFINSSRSCPLVSTVPPCSPCNGQNNDVRNEWVIISLWAGSLTHPDLVHLSQQYHPAHPVMKKQWCEKWVSHYKPLSWFIKSSRSCPLVSTVPPCSPCKGQNNDVRNEQVIISLWADSLNHPDLVHLSQQYHPAQPVMDKTMTWEMRDSL